jgi:hypothetical protein
MPTVTKNYFLIGALLTLLIAACGGNGGGSDTGPGDPGIVNPDPGNVDTGPDIPDLPPMSIDPEAYKIVYTYREKIPNCDIGPENEKDPDGLIIDSDLHIIWPDGTKQTPVTNLIPKEDGKNCQNGCFVDRNMSWLAVADKINMEGSFDFSFGKFNSSLQANIVKLFELKDAIDFHFAGPYFMFSRLEGQDTGGPGGRYYSMTRVILNGLEIQPMLPAFPPLDFREGSTYKGKFRVDRTGEQLVMLNPTIGSQRVFYWNQGVLQDLDYICPNEFEGVCASAGSQYSDGDPAAIDPTGRFVIATFQTDDALTIYKYDLEFFSKSFNNLMAVPPGSTFESAACFNTPSYFPWTRVKQIQVSTDGKDAILLVSNDCPGIEKEQTDLIAIPLDAIGDGTPITAADIRNITNNPNGEIVENVIMDSFDLAPDGMSFTFVGSPIMDTNGQYLNDSDARASKDREVFVGTLDGKIRNQLTNDLCYKALGPLTVTPSGAPPGW